MLYLLDRSGERPSDIGLDASQPGKDIARGAVLAAVIGGAGLLLYIAAFHLGISLNMVPEDLPAVWWRIPVLLLSAAHDGMLEEIVVLGLPAAPAGPARLDAVEGHRVSAVLRGSYHLYQGFGAFIGNTVMGLIFGVPVQALGPVHPDDHRAHADRRGDVRRLRRAARQGVVAALARATP